MKSKEECQLCEQQAIDYLEDQLTETENRSFEKHLLSSVPCFQELQEVKQTLFELNNEKDTITPPSSFFENLEAKINSSSKVKQPTIYSKWIWIAVFFLSFIGLSTAAYATNGFQDITDWMKKYSADEAEMIDELIAAGVAETINLYDSDQNIGITLTTIIADNEIINIYYEVEDLSQEELYMIHYDGIEPTLISQSGEKVSAGSDFFRVQSHKRLHTDKPYTVAGMIGIRSTSLANKMELNISELTKVNNLTSFDEPINKFDTKYEPVTADITGDWDFNIVVDRSPIYKIQAYNELEMPIEDSSFRVTGLELTPTHTKLNSSYENEYISSFGEEDRYLSNVFIESFKVNGVELERKDFHMYEPIYTHYEQEEIESIALFISKAKYEHRLYNSREEIILSEEPFSFNLGEQSAQIEIVDRDDDYVYIQIQTPYYEGRTIPHHSFELHSEVGHVYRQLTTSEVIVRDSEIIDRDEHFFQLSEEERVFHSYTTDYYIAVPRETYEKHPIKYIRFAGFSEWIEVNEMIELDIHQ